MPRDDFSRSTVERLAKRVGMHCLNPDCRAPTSGPSSEDSSTVTNTGVAAHICAASPGGSRYDPDMTSEQRSGITNGIWLCQKHAKLIDDDERSFPVSLLQEWKETAEGLAFVEARGYAVRKARPFADLDKKIPQLIGEMRENLRETPLVRQFAILPNNRVRYSGSEPQFVYFEEDDYGPYLRSMMTILIRAGAIYDVTSTRVPRYNFNEDFVSFLIGDE